MKCLKLWNTICWTNQTSVNSFIKFNNLTNTVKPQWLKHLWDHENLFETWVVPATEG